MRVYKQNDSTEKRKTERTRGARRKKARKPRCTVLFSGVDQKSKSTHGGTPQGTKEEKSTGRLLVTSPKDIAQERHRASTVQNSSKEKRKMASRP